MANEFGISLDDAVDELQYLVDEAIQFMWSEFEDDWAVAERYFAGGCDIPTAEGRSNAVKTEARDIIHTLMPSIMRILYQSRKPVEYLPSNIRHAAFIDQQALFVNQLFRASGGYKILKNCVLEGLKLKSGPVKTWYESNPAPEYFEYNALVEEEIEQLEASDDIEITEREEHPELGEKGFFTVKGYKYHHFGKIHIEDFPIYEFFVSRNAKDLEDARVHGHHRAIKVAEAIEMGLEYDDWADLTGTDPEEKYASESSRARRGYQTDASDDDSEDLLQKEILLTEVYCKFDLNGDGIEERYCFYLGGTTYKYIDHFEIEDYCIDLVTPDPIPNTVIGASIMERLIEQQDNETSILRAIIDNAHMANNPRVAGNPDRVDFNDVMNNAVGAPIKTKGANELQIIDIPFTGQQLIPFLQYLEQQSENRVGVSKASRGLDPDALQSTDKEAVRNTIAVGEGQAELIARNIAETGLIGVFNKLLRLSIRYLDRYQVVRTRGLVLPVDTVTFDPSLAAEPNVGLGTASHQEKLQTLGFILQKQEQIIGAFGMDNPFTSLSQMYNTLEDIVDLGGLKDPGRYFQVVTPQMEEMIARGRAQQQAEQQQMAQQAQPMDPSAALLQSEQMKAQASLQRTQTDAQVKLRDLQLEQERHRDEMDLRRDSLVQDRVISLRKIRGDELNSRIQMEQSRNNEDAGAGDGADGSSQQTGTE